MIHAHVTTDPSILDQIANGALAGAGIGVMVFTIVYMVFFKWHKTFAGIAILMFTTSLSFVLLLGITTHLAGGDYFLRDWLRLAAFVLCLVTAWSLVALLVWGWLRGRKPLHLLERESVKRTPSGTLVVAESDPDTDTTPDRKARP